MSLQWYTVRGWQKQARGIRCNYYIGHTFCDEDCEQLYSAWSDRGVYSSNFSTLAEAKQWCNQIENELIKEAVG